MSQAPNPSDPHAGMQHLRVGPELASAKGMMILVHGRGGDANDMLGLLPYLDAEDLHVVALQAAGNSWYPFPFMSPTGQNEPGRTSGLDLIHRSVTEAEAAGLRTSKVVLGGFSQGACLALEYVHTNRRKYGAVLGFSGGLIGPPGTVFGGADALDGTPVFLGCSDRDPHIPRERVAETAAALSAGGATVDERIYPAMGHTINADELSAAWELVQRVTTE